MNSLTNSAIFVHLLQSTIFALLCALLAWAMRRNAARIRFALWLAASLKFLVPFSALTTLGSSFEFLRPAGIPVTVTYTPQRLLDLGRSTEIITRGGATQTVHRAAGLDWVPLLIGLWACGFGFVLWRWTREWLRMRALIRAAGSIDLDAPIIARSTQAPIEPGVFGIWRPVLLIPESLRERLSREELAAVLTHELAHVRRRDNLWAFLHMLVEAALWFYPLVFWIGKKLVEERERACDEVVLGSGNAPQSYAEGILKVCELCIEPAPACAAGVTGADLKKRVRAIMANQIAEGLGMGKKALLAAAGIAVIAAPIMVGIIDAPSLRAQENSKLRFEVASVKANSSEERHMSEIGLQVLPGGRLSAKNIPLFYLIAWAYDVPFQGAGSRLKGTDVLKSLGPEAARFDIEATAEKSVVANDKTQLDRTNKMRAMVRNLLADRFHLVIRAETRDTPVYAVVVGKNGLKLERSILEEKDCEDSGDASHECHNFNGGMGRGLHTQAASMEDLVRYVANWSDRPIVDRTGLKGLFKIETPGWAPVDAPRGDGSQKGEDGVPWSERPTLFTIFEGMGLKLEATHAPLETFTIVSVEKPVEN